MPDEPDSVTDERRLGVVYEVEGWREGIDPPGDRWGATCQHGEVFRAHTKDEVRAQLADHFCDPSTTSFFKRASTDAEWAAAQLARLPGGGPTPPTHGPGEEVEAFDSAVFDRRGTLYRSALKHWSPGLRVTAAFQTGSATFNVEAIDEHALSHVLDVAMTLPDQPSVVRLYLEPNAHPTPGQLSTLRFDFNREYQVAAAVLVAIDKDDGVHEWMSRGAARRSNVHLAHDTWNASETQFPPESFVTTADLRRAVLQWAFGDGVIPPPVVDWVHAPDVGWL